MSEEVPPGWAASTLGPLCLKITDGSHLSPPTQECGLPIATVENMENRSIDVASCRTISRSDFDALVNSSCSPEIGDVLFSKDGTVGKTFVFEQREKIVLLSSIAIIRTNRVKLSPHFLSQFLQSPYFYKDIENSKTGSAIKRVVLRDIKSLNLCLPPVEQQQKIAAILTSVDDVIEKTEAQISKLQDLKKGMMQELLSKGIGHTEFKDSPVGRIPKGWRCVRLESVLESGNTPMRSGPFGSALLKRELVPTGIPFLGIDNVHVEQFVTNYKRFVTSEKFEELKRYAVRENDVMITIMGTVGRACVVPACIGKALSSKHVWTMTFDKAEYLPELICWQLNFAPWVTRQFKNESQGGVMDAISSKTLRSLLLPCPPIAEQVMIAKSHHSISQTIQAKKSKLATVLSLKKALMQDLLTGKVRVKVN